MSLLSRLAMVGLVCSFAACASEEDDSFGAGPPSGGSTSNTGGSPSQGGDGTGAGSDGGAPQTTVTNTAVTNTAVTNTGTTVTTGPTTSSGGSCDQFACLAMCAQQQAFGQCVGNMCECMMLQGGMGGGFPTGGFGGGFPTGGFGGGFP